MDCSIDAFDFFELEGGAAGKGDAGLEEAFAGAVCEGAVLLVDGLEVHWLPEGPGFDIQIGEELLKVR